MSCQACWPSGQKRSYMLTLIDAVTHREGRCILQTSCVHDAQQWAEQMASKGGLTVHDKARDDEPFLMFSPRVIDIDEKAAAHIPLLDVDPV